MNRSICQWLLAGMQLISAGAAAQPPEATQSARPDEPQCAFQRKNHPNYILWVCNPEGTETSREGSVLWLRKNAAGVDVMTSVWRGPSTDLIDRAEDIISSHDRSHARCQRYVYLARADGRHMTWNVGTASMVSQLKASTSQGSDICYAPEPGTADFVIVWSENENRMPYAFTVQVPATADDSDAPVRGQTPGPGVAKTGIDGALSVYRVDPGMDNSILRLGLSLFTAKSAPPASHDKSSTPLGQALRFVSALPTAAPKEAGLGTADPGNQN